MLTSAPRRRRTPMRNRSIPTILWARFDVGLVDVSAVDTGLPAGSTPRGLGGRAERSHPDAGFTFPSQTSSDSRPGAGGACATPAPACTRPEPVYSTRVGIYWPVGVAGGFGSGLLHKGRDLLAGGCAYCTKAPPTWSAPDPPPADPDPRAVQAGRQSSDCEQPNRPGQHGEQRSSGPPRRCREVAWPRGSWRP